MGTLVENIEITIDGKKDYGKDYNFYNFRLMQELLTPNALNFTMQKKEFDGNSVADSEFEIPKKLMGAEVKFKATVMRFDAEDKKQLSFKGFIANVNISHRSDMYAEQMIDVQAVSHDYLLKDHPHCFSYEEMTLKDIVTKTLKPYKISNEINPRLTGAIPYTVQYNESNYQFLVRLAQRYGEWMYHDGEKWIFGKIKERDTVKLNPRYDIQDYTFQTVLTHHTLKHAHHNYLKYENPVKSDSAITDLMKSNYHTLTDEVMDKSASLFTKETFQHLQCSNPEVNEIDELEVSAKAQLLGEKTSQVVCSGSTVIAELTIGSVIEIYDHLYNTEKDYSKIKHDNLIITGITHAVEVNGHYSNSFVAYPAKSEYPPYYNSDLSPTSGPQRAKVMDNKDPKKLGRIRVQFLWQEEQDQSLMTPWIRIAQPHGGDDKGFYFIPEIDEEVMVDFENGNAEKPYVVGTLWHGKQLPDEPWYSDNNDFKVIRTRRHTIVFTDKEDSGLLTIYDHEERINAIQLNIEEQSITLSSKGNINLFAEKDIVMKAGGNRISTIKEVDDVSAGSHNYKADGAIHIEGKTFFAQGEEKAVINSSSLTQIQSDSTTNVLGNGSVLVGAGGSLTVSADAGMDLSANANMTLKGAMVKIN